ncbi:MAG: hypothetical protein U0670_22905 [Anaerolineae bacterium]
MAVRPAPANAAQLYPPSSSESDPPRANMHWLWGIMLSYRGMIIGALGSGFLGGITAAMEPYLIGQIVDHVNHGVQSGQILTDIVPLLVMGITTVIALFGQRYITAAILRIRSHLPFGGCCSITC